MGELDANGATELSRLRAAVIRAAPVIAAALELRRIGLACDTYEADQQERYDTGYQLHRTKCGTFVVALEQAYATALAAFDKAVLDAALSEFEEFRAPHIAPKTEPTNG